MTPDSAAAAFWAGYIRNRNVDERTAADGALPVAGGYALYVAGTAFDRVLGAGWDRPLVPEAPMGNILALRWAASRGCPRTSTSSTNSMGSAASYRRSS